MASQKKSTSNKKGKLRSLAKSKKVLTEKQAKAVKGGALDPQGPKLWKTVE